MFLKNKLLWSLTFMFEFVHFFTTFVSLNLMFLWIENKNIVTAMIKGVPFVARNVLNVDHYAGWRGAHS